MGTFGSSRAGKRTNAVGNSVVRMAAWLSYGGNSEGIHQGVRWHSIPSRPSNSKCLTEKRLLCALMMDAEDFMHGSVQDRSDRRYGFTPFSSLRHAAPLRRLDRFNVSLCSQTNWM